MGAHITLTAAVTPADSEGYTLKWAVDDTSLATIDPSSGVLTGVAAGSVKVTCTAQNSDKTTVTSTAHAVAVTA